MVVREEVRARRCNSARYFWVLYFAVASFQFGLISTPNLSCAALLGTWKHEIWTYIQENWKSRQQQKRHHPRKSSNLETTFYRSWSRTVGVSIIVSSISWHFIMLKSFLRSLFFFINVDSSSNCSSSSNEIITHSVHKWTGKWIFKNHANASAALFTDFVYCKTISHLVCVCIDSQRHYLHF